MGVQGELLQAELIGCELGGFAEAKFDPEL